MSETQDIQALEWRLIDAHGEPLTEWRRTAASFDGVVGSIHIETRSVRAVAPASANLPTMQEIMLREAMAHEGVPADVRERVIDMVLSGTLPPGVRVERHPEKPVTALSKALPTMPLPPKTGRDLLPGDYATTDFNGSGRCDRVQIIARRQGVAMSQSGIQYQVRPALKNGSPTRWIDADWFEPAIE